MGSGLSVIPYLELILNYVYVAVTMSRLLALSVLTVVIFLNQKLKYLKLYMKIYKK